MQEPKPTQKILTKAIVKASQSMIQKCQNPVLGTDTDEWLGDMYYTLREIELALNTLCDLAKPESSTENDPTLPQMRKRFRI